MARRANPLIGERLPGKRENLPDAMQLISSRDNPGLKAVRALVRSRREREKQGCFVMEGVRALRALSDGSALAQYELREAWVSEEAPADLLPALEAAGAPLRRIPHALMEGLSDCRTSQGVLGVVHCRPMKPEIRADAGCYLLLDRLMDPGNMGTLIRSAAAFGFDAVLLLGDCVDPFNPKAVRATMGALPFSNVWKIDEKMFQSLEDRRYELIATVLRGGEPVNTASFGERNVLVIGNEANGVSADILQRAQRRISIPMSTAVESLNAATAGSICMPFLRRFHI